MASAASRAVPTLCLAGRVVSLGSSKQKLQLPGNCFSQFLTSKSNHLARYVKETKNVDKAFKLAKSASEFSYRLLDLTGNSGEISLTLQNTTSTLSTARSVIALTNAYNGAIPGFVSAVRSCYQHIKQCISPNRYGSEKVIAYNECYINRADHALAAIDSLSVAVGASTYVATFGVVRPVLLANKLANTPFLRSELKQALGSSVDYMMTANHAAGVVGKIAVLAYETRAYSRAKKQLDSLIQAEQDVARHGEMLGSLRQSHLQALKKTILALLEKAFELIADIVKFVPMPHYTALRLVVVSGLVTVSSALGCYSLWTSS